MPKHVASRTLPDAIRNARVIEGEVTDAVASLKEQQPGGRPAAQRPASVAPAGRNDHVRERHRRPEPLPYRWDVRGDDVSISVTYGELDATFTGSWRDDGFSGGWRPNLGEAPSINCPTTSAAAGSASQA